MIVTEKKIEGREAWLTIELTPEEVEDGMERAYRRLVNRVEVPGFRKGKAPRLVLERHLGHEKVLDQALDEVLPEFTEKALADEGLQAFTSPSAEILQRAPVVFRVRVPLPPVVELGDYKTIRVPKEPVQVKEEAVNGLVDQLRHQRGTWESVSRPVAMADTITADVDSTIEGAPFLNRTGFQYNVREDSGFPAPGFGQELVGMNNDEVREFKLRFPADHARAELAGKEASFKVTLKDIKEEKLPELTDEFAKTINPELDTVEALRQRVSDNLREQLEEKAETIFEDQAVDALVKMSKIEFPEVLVDVELERLVSQQLQRARSSVATQEEFKALLNQLPAEELEKRYRPIARQRVTSSLALGKLAAEEKIEVSEADIDNETLELLKEGSGNPEEQRVMLSSPENRRRIKDLLLSRKTLARLVEIAASTEIKAEESEKVEEEKHD